MEDLRGHDNVRGGVLVEKGESGLRESASRVLARCAPQSTKVKCSRAAKWKAYRYHCPEYTI